MWESWGLRDKRKKAQEKLQRNEVKNNKKLTSFRRLLGHSARKGQLQVYIYDVVRQIEIKIKYQNTAKSGFSLCFSRSIITRA